MYKDYNDDYRGGRYSHEDRFRGDRYRDDDRGPRGPRRQREREDRYSSEEHPSSDEIYSCPVKAGKRTYFFDVKATKDNSDYYLTITESKRRVENDGSFSFDKHKIFLYKEDFEKFAAGLQDAVNYIKTNTHCMDNMETESKAEEEGGSPEEDFREEPDQF